MLETLWAIRQKTGAKLTNGYGSTEVAGFVSYSDENDDFDTLLVTAGRAPPPIEVRIVDEHGCDVPSGHVGQYSFAALSS
jgi:long-subunit acyl-CoA synthetase (AMP-forming)